HTRSYFILIDRAYLPALAPTGLQFPSTTAISQNYQPRLSSFLLSLKTDQTSLSIQLDAATVAQYQIQVTARIVKLKSSIITSFNLSLSGNSSITVTTPQDIFNSVINSPTPDLALQSLQQINLVDINYITVPKL